MMSRAWHRIAGSKAEEKDPSQDQSESKEPLSDEKSDQSIKQPINQQYPVYTRQSESINQTNSESIHQSFNVDGPEPSAPFDPPSYHQPTIIEAPVKPSTNEANDQSISQPAPTAKSFTGAPVAQVAVPKPKAVNKPNIVPALQPIDPSNNQSFHQLSNQPVSQPIHHSTDSPVNQPMQHPPELVQEYFVPPPSYQPSEQLVTQQLDQPANLPVNQSIAQAPVPSTQPINAYPIAVPPPGEHISLSTRLSNVVDSVRTSRVAGYVDQLVQRHVSPELRAFLMNPSIGQLVFSPRLLFQAYHLYSAIKAPFVDVFKGILVGGAIKALNTEQQSSDHSIKHRLMMRSLRKIAASKDLDEGTLGGDVMRVIVNNLSMAQITQLFSFFGRAPAPDTVAIVPAAAT